MRFAAREVDITPQRPCWQGGYAQRTGHFGKVHDPITTTVFVMTIGESKTVWVSMDVVGTNQAFVDALVEAAARKGLALNRRNLIVGSTHTHSGPLITGGKDGPYAERQPDPEYVELVLDKVTTAIAEAWNEEAPEVTVKYSRTLIDGLYSNRNDKNKRADKYVHRFGFFRGEELVGMAFSMAHHCTILGPNFTECSGDLFGELRRRIQADHPVPVLMIQGNAGDMGNKQYRKSNLFDEVEYQSKNLLDQIEKKAEPWQELELVDCGFKEGAYKAVYDVDATVFEQKKADFEEKLKTETDFDTVKLLVTGIRSYERKIAVGSGHVEREMPFRIYNWGDLQVVAVPGELGSILGLRIKGASKAKVCLIYGYSDPQNLGYMVEREAYDGPFCQEVNVTDYPAGIPDEYVQTIIDAL